MLKIPNILPDSFSILLRSALKSNIVTDKGRIKFHTASHTGASIGIILRFAATSPIIKARTAPLICEAHLYLCSSKIHTYAATIKNCLLYTSDAADDLLCVDLGGRRIIKKKKRKNI